MQDLAKFLSSPDNKEECFRLYQKYGKNQNILRAILSNKTSALYQTVLFELKILARQHKIHFDKPQIKVLEVEKRERKEVFEHKKQQDFEELSRQQQHWYNKGAKLSNVLSDLAFQNPDSPEAKELVSEIMACKQKYNLIADIKRQYDATGTMPTQYLHEQKEKPEPEQNKYKDFPKDELLKKQKLLRSQISKAKNSIAENRNNEDKLKKYSSKLQSLEKELLIVENLLCN